MNTSFLNPLYWFSLDAANVSTLFGKCLLGFFLLLFLVGIVCRIVVIHKSKDRYLKLIGKRLVTFCVTMGIMGVFLFFFSYEGIQFFGARFWYLLWFIGFVLWAVAIVKFVIKDVPALREKNVLQHAKSKYIPGRKK